MIQFDEHIFQMGRNHQLVILAIYLEVKSQTLPDNWCSIADRFRDTNHGVKIHKAL